LARILGRFHGSKAGVRGTIEKGLATCFSLHNPAPRCMLEHQDPPPKQRDSMFGPRHTVRRSTVAQEVYILILNSQRSLHDLRLTYPCAVHLHQPYPARRIGCLPAPPSCLCSCLAPVRAFGGSSPLSPVTLITPSGGIVTQVCL